MKWGIRRYQNPDGSLTAAGKKRYGTDATKVSVKTLKKQAARGNIYRSENSNVSKELKKIGKQFDKTKEKKELANASKFINDLSDEFKKKYPGKPLYFDKDTADWYNELQTAYEKKGKELLKQNNDKIAGAFLAGSAIVNGILYGKTQYQNKRLRAYYAH